MDVIKQKIRNLLNQDMVLESEFKQKVLSHLEQLNLEQLNQVLLSLEKLLDEETAVVENILKEKPYFFIEVQHEVLDIMHHEFEKEEAIVKTQAEQQLKIDIETLSNQN